MTIDWYDDRLADPGGRGVIAVDVLRSTTTAVTAVSLGRRCFPVSSLESAMRLAEQIDGALLAGELGGNMPYGFELTNSPAAVADRKDVDRPMILISSSGTRLLCEASDSTSPVYVGCLRNHSAVAQAVAAREESVAVVGAGTRGEFREEDQLCCAWIAHGLLERGFDAASSQTEALVARWHAAPADALLDSKSVEYLRRTGQEHDLEFVLSHVDDLDATFVLDGDELRKDA